jgi:hypothetical protein
MIHTDEDDEFDRIERENKMKGQPYHWEVDAIKAAVLIEREECARLCEQHGYEHYCGNVTDKLAETIRARSDTSAERVDTNGEHKHDN